MDRLEVPQGTFELSRYPIDPRDELRAWTAADEYLLTHVGSLPVTGETAVLNDSWGALAVGLAGLQPQLISDSYLSREATLDNLARNGLPTDAARVRSDLQPPPARIDLLIVKVPKSLALLADQLRRIAPSLHPGTVVVGAGMVKEVHTSTLETFERLVGPTRTSLAVKKARLIFSTPADELQRFGPTEPPTYRLPDGVGAVSGLPLTQHHGVFSAGRLDLGTRLLLQHLPEPAGPQRVVDLACGDGILGLAAAMANPAAELTFIDESYRAVASAKSNFDTHLGAGRPAEFVVADGLANAEASSIDLVLMNPPFHSQHAQSDQTAWRMFRDSRRVLRRGGELWVVGNRHLGYHAKLKRLFGNCEAVASNTKFVVLRAARR